MNTNTGEYSLFFKASRWKYLHLDWINLYWNDLYYSKLKFCSTGFVKIMFWFFHRGMQISNDLRSKDMISPGRIHAVSSFQACYNQLLKCWDTHKKKQSVLLQIAAIVTGLWDKVVTPLLPSPPFKVVPPSSEHGLVLLATLKRGGGPGSRAQDHGQAI